MSRYRGPRLRIVRRLGELPGLTQKLPKSQAPPGQHGATAKKPTQYGVRLMEKQKLRYNYGVTEHQLVNYVKKARCDANCLQKQATFAMQDKYTGCTVAMQCFQYLALQVPMTYWHCKYVDADVVIAGG